MNTAPNENKRIAVIGATGHQEAQSYMPCGPPWMRKASGYFLPGSKPTGL